MSPIAHAQRYAAWCFLLLELQGYDTTIIPLVIMIILMSVAAVAALVGLLVFHVRAAFYARPLNFHADVLHQQ